jgi:hypothetical protein
VIVCCQERKLEIMKTLFDDKIKQASLGDAAYNQAHGES